MYRNKFLFVFPLLLFFLITACGDDPTPPEVSEIPMKTVIDRGVVVDTSYATVIGDYEFGNKFYASVNGQITALGCKIASAGNIRVSLWEFDSESLIAATTISVSDTSVFNYNSISPVEIQANTRYVVSLNSKNGGLSHEIYIYQNRSGAEIYPFSSGSITYESFQEKISATSAFPEYVITANQVLVAGVPDFIFMPEGE